MHQHQTSNAPVHSGRKFPSPFMQQAPAASERSDIKGPDAEQKPDHSR